MSAPTEDPIRFGAFELDPKNGQLTRSGRRVHLTPQSIRILALLTGRSGETVTRDEIRLALWGNDTFVEFDAAMNACVSQIRTALGDKPTAPRFVETVPRRGYRFIAPVTRTHADTVPAPVITETAHKRPRRAGTWMTGTLGLLVIGLV